MAIQNWMNANVSIHSRGNAPRPKSDKAEGTTDVFSKILRSKTPESEADSKTVVKSNQRLEENTDKDNVMRDRKHVKEVLKKDVSTDEVEKPTDGIDVEDETEKIKTLLQLLNQLIEKIQSQPEEDKELTFEDGSKETSITEDVMADLVKLQEMVGDIFAGKKENIALVGALNQLKTELEKVEGMDFSLKDALKIEGFKKLILESTPALKSIESEEQKFSMKGTEEMVKPEIVDLPKDPQKPVTKMQGTETVDKNIQTIETEKELSGVKVVEAEDSKAEEVSLDKGKAPIATQFQQLINKQPVGVLQPAQNPMVSKNPIVNQVFNLVKGPIQVNENGTMLKMKLQPEELGNVQLKLSLQKGVVLAELKVENELVKAAVESNLDQLKQNLSNRGFQVSQVSVAVDLNNKDQTASNFNQQQHQQNNGRKHYFDGVEEITDDKIFEALHLKEKGIGNRIDYLG